MSSHSKYTSRRYTQSIAKGTNRGSPDRHCSTIQRPTEKGFAFGRSASFSNSISILMLIFSQSTSTYIYQKNENILQVSCIKSHDGKLLSWVSQYQLNISSGWKLWKLFYVFLPTYSQSTYTYAVKQKNTWQKITNKCWLRTQIYLHLLITKYDFYIEEPTYALCKL